MGVYQLEPFIQNISGLAPSHLEDLRESGLNNKTIQGAGFKSVPPRLINKILGFNAQIDSLLEMPYPGTDFSRYKLFPPLTDREGHKVKYFQPKDSAPRLYVPPGFDCAKKLWRFTEGEKKALKATQEGLNCLGLGGIWNFASKNAHGQPELIPDLKNIPWKNKTVEIVPDADFKTNDHVKRAVYRLAQLLEAEGAKVFIVELPGALKLDDFLCQHTAADFEKLSRITCNENTFVSSKIAEDLKKADTDELDHPDIFRGVAKIFADEYANISEVPREFLFWAFLGCLGSLISGKARIKDTEKVTTCLYLLIIGASADVRKSTAIKKAVEFFITHIPEFAVSYGVGSAEGLAALLKEKNKVLLTIDEFAGFVGKCNAQNSVLLPCVTTLFENVNYENRTKNESIELHNVFLALLAASTIDTFQKVWTPNFTAIGFDNRLLLITGKVTKAVPLPKQIELMAETRIRRALIEALDKLGNEKAYEMTKEAQEVFKRWYFDLHKRNSIVTKRIDTIAHRLLVLFAVNECVDIIDVDIVERVILFLEWQIKVREELAPIDAVNLVATLEESIRRKVRGKGSIRERELQLAVHAHRSGLHFYKAAVTNLIENKEIARIKGVFTWRGESVAKSVATT